VGLCVGSKVGDVVGPEVGDVVGPYVGIEDDGSSVGTGVGGYVGRDVVGLSVGDGVGSGEGFVVGEVVGAWVGGCSQYSTTPQGATPFHDTVTLPSAPSGPATTRNMVCRVMRGLEMVSV